MVSYYKVSPKPSCLFSTLKVTTLLYGQVCSVLENECYQQEQSDGNDCLADRESRCPWAGWEGAGTCCRQIYVTPCLPECTANNRIGSATYAQNINKAAARRLWLTGSVESVSTGISTGASSNSSSTVRCNLLWCRCRSLDCRSTYTSLSSSICGTGCHKCTGNCLQATIVVKVN